MFRLSRGLVAPVLFKHPLAKRRSATKHGTFLIRHQFLLVTEPAFQSLALMGYRFLIPSSCSTSFGEIAAGGDELLARAGLFKRHGSGARSKMLRSNWSALDTLPSGRQRKKRIPFRRKGHSERHAAVKSARCAAKESLRSRLLGESSGYRPRATYLAGRPYQHPLHL